MADSDKVILLKIELDKAQASANIEKLKNSLKKLDGRRKEARVIVRKLRLEEAKLSDLRAKSSKSISNHANELKNANKQTGAATSATLEFGRVLSDAPYGIRGVANNLQQLASNLFFMSRGTDAVTGKTIGFLGALGTLGKSLLGPAGILVAFQGITAALDYFFGASTKAEESVKGLTSEVYASGLVMNNYVDELNDVNISEERRAVLVQELTKAIPTLTAADLKYGANLDEVRLKIKQYTLAQASRIEMDKLVQENSELLSKQMRVDLVNSTEDQEEKLKIIKGLLEEEGIELEKAVNKSYQMGQSNLTLRKKTNSELIQDFNDLAKDIKKESDPILERIERISQGLGLDPSKTKGGSSIKRAKVTAFDTSQITKDAKKYVDEVMKMEKKNVLLIATNNVDKLIIERDFQLKRLSMLKGDNSALIEEYVKYYDTLISVAEGKLLGKGKIDGKTPTKSGGSEEPFTLEEGLQKYMELQSSMTGFLNGEYDRQLTIEQNKTNALNNELNQRLLNENLSKDERERIQLQIGRNDDKLRKKQEEIERKRFKLNKAANIATASINTYLAATQALSSETIPTAAKPFVVAATIASGLMQVASIARQKFQSSAGSGGTIGASGGGGGGGEGREFNFNLAGSTQSNQLTQSIASQLNQPIQAYVVSSEITSQQQLDLNISNTATIG